MVARAGHAFFLDDRSTCAGGGWEIGAQTEQEDYTPNRDIVQTSAFRHGVHTLCLQRRGTVRAKRRAGDVAPGELRVWSDQALDGPVWIPAPAFARTGFARE